MLTISAAKKTGCVVIEDGDGEILIKAADLHLLIEAIKQVHTQVFRNHDTATARRYVKAGAVTTI